MRAIITSDAEARIIIIDTDAASIVVSTSDPEELYAALIKRLAAATDPRDGIDDGGVAEDEDDAESQDTNGRSRRVSVDVEVVEAEVVDNPGEAERAKGAGVTRGAIDPDAINEEKAERIARTAGVLFSGEADPTADFVADGVRAVWSQLQRISYRGKRKNK